MNTIGTPPTPQNADTYAHLFIKKCLKLLTEDDPHTLLKMYLKVYHIVKSNDYMNIET